MLSNRYAQAYRTASVETASPARLILMLFDGADCFLRQALTGFEEDSRVARNEKISNNLVKAQNVINELRCSLNLDAGGELAVTLNRLYVYMNEQIRVANLKKEREPILVTQSLIGTIRSGWAEMMQKQISTSSSVV